jgi:hypothetical protein
MCIKTGLITERYENEISGVIGCYDRVIIRGTPGLFAYANGMTSFFYAHNYKIFDFANIFKPVTDSIISNIKSMAEKMELK